MREDERWALRMASQSPCFNRKCGAWRLLDGTEHMWVLDHAVPPTGTNLRGASRIADALERFEFWAVADLVCDRISRQL